MLICFAVEIWMGSTIVCWPRLYWQCDIGLGYVTWHFSKRKKKISAFQNAHLGPRAWDCGSVAHFALMIGFPVLSLNENPRVQHPGFHVASSASSTMPSANNNQPVIPEWRSGCFLVEETTCLSHCLGHSLPLPDICGRVCRITSNFLWLFGVSSLRPGCP